MNKVRDFIKKNYHFSRRTAVFSGIYGFLVGLSYVLGYQLEKYNMTLPGISGKFKIFLLALLIMIPAGLIAYSAFMFMEKSGASKGKTGDKPKAGSRKVFLISFIAILICRIPVFLAYYPAVMSYDFGRQYIEASRGHVWFYDYQPLIHTEVIRIFYLIGTKLGSVETGMALLCIFQVAVTSAILAYTISFMVRVTGRTFLFPVFAVLYALLPMHELISVIMTKDVFFSAFFVLFICLLYERSQKKSIPLDIAIILTAVLNITFRKNSVYAMVFLIVGFLIYEKKIRDKILSAVLIIICIASGLGAHNAMLYGFKCIKGNNSEMYSVPMMQVMRTYVNQKDNLTQEQYEMICKLLPLEMDGIGYTPYCSDCVKNYSGYRTEVWGGGVSGFFEEWKSLGLAYPNEYIDAFLFLNKGYWYLPDKMYAEVFGVGAETGKGLLHTYNCTFGLEDGVTETCYAPGVRSYYEQVINENAFFTWPLLNQLFRPAFYFWLFIFTVFAAIWKKNRKGWLLLTYPLFYMATLFFGPLVYLRYMYPIILSLPVLMSVILFERSREK